VLSGSPLAGTCAEAFSKKPGKIERIVKADHPRNIADTLLRVQQKTGGHAQANFRQIGNRGNPKRELKLRSKMLFGISS